MLLLIAAMSMTGANVPLGKALMASIPLESFLVLRFAIASAALAALIRLEPGPSLGSLTPRQWISVALLGGVGSLLFTVFLLEGVKRTSAVDAGIITATLPAVVALLGMLRGERPGPAALGMIGLAVAGVALIQTAAAHSGSSALLGNVLIGLAVLCEATFALVSRGISRVLTPLRLSYAVSLVSLALCLPLLPWVSRSDLAALDAEVWALALWYISAASILCTALWYRGVPHVATWQAGLATAAIPVAALVISSLYLGESIGPAQLAGSALVIAAIVVGTLSRRAR